jgi:hypothetical protein
VSESDIAVIMNELNHIKSDVADIKELQRRANGRTSKLEHWRTFLIGAWAVLTIASSVIYGLFLKAM